MISSVQIIGSKACGGAERWYLRFTRALAGLGHPTHGIIRRGSMLESADWGGVPFTAVPLKTVWDPVSRRGVARELKHIAPDLVQTYMGRATRNTHTGRAGPVHVARLGGYYKLHGYRHADAWVGNTRGICDYLVGNGFPAQRVVHIYNFLDPARPVPRDRVDTARAALDIPPDARVLVTAGRMVPFKGHRYLVDALARLPAELGGRPVRLVVLGDGPLRDDLQRRARDQGIAERIRWPGWQRDPDAYFQMADLVVFPSLESEPFGNVVLEAWAHGRPLVTTRFRGAMEFVRHGEDAWQVACGDAESLAVGIREVLADEGLAGSLAAAGLARVERDFGVRPIMQRYVELYERLIEHGRP
jgi:hypothetical protein